MSVIEAQGLPLLRGLLLRPHRDIRGCIATLLGDRILQARHPMGLNLIGEGFTITSLLIDPVAVFLAMFFMGGRFDISFDFSSVLLSFVGGTALGAYACLLLTSGYALSVGLWQPLESQFELVLLYDGLGALRMAPVGFSGLALACFARRRVSTTRQSSA